MRIGDTFEADERLDDDGDLKLESLGYSHYEFLNKDEVIQLRNHLNKILEETK